MAASNYLDTLDMRFMARARDDLEPIWRALASPIRRAILDELRDGPRTTGALAERFPRLSRFAVMQHLRVLEEADLVTPRRDGRERYNYLNPVPIQRVFDRWVSRYMKPWTEALVSLQDQLETESRKERA
jgi:DNA-binding transcriptional ArsR family regulator